MRCNIRVTIWEGLIRGEISVVITIMWSILYYLGIGRLVVLSPLMVWWVVGTRVTLRLILHIVLLRKVGLLLIVFF